MYGKIIFKRVVSTCSVRYSKKPRSKKLLEFLADMPKNTGNILEVQRQRVNIAKKTENYLVSTIYLQVLGSGARGVPNTLYLFTDQKRYLFNCGEGTQRLAHEHKVRLSKLEHIFITNKTWRNIGGLPGASLTLQDVGVPNLTLHGPEGLDELYNATKRFVIMKEMNVNTVKCSPNEDFKDNVMSVKYVLLGPDDSVLSSDPQPRVKKAKREEIVEKEFEEFIHDQTDYYKRPEKPADTNKNKNVKRNVKAHEKDPIKVKCEKVLQDLQKKSKYTVAFICTFKKRLGTLDLKKCVERGVKPGPILGKLKMGEDVVLADGTLVLSKDVKTPDDPGPVFIVMEVPDITYLKESEFAQHFDNCSNAANVPALVVHLTPPHVFHHPTYRAFMSMFGPTTNHLVLNEQNSCLGSEAVHRTQYKLHLLDADMFPLLKDASLPAVWHAHPPVTPTDSPAKIKGLEELKNKIALAQFQNIIHMEGSCKGDGSGSSDDVSNKLNFVAGRTMTTIHLRPKREVDRSAEPKLQIEEYIREAMTEDGFGASLEKFRKIVETVRYAKNPSSKEYPKVVFLGTGSCIPSKTRNTSCIVIQVDENRSMLLDCGEGTFGQLVRFFGPKRVDSFLRTLKAIYVSHLHADHHLGLIGVLQARRQALEAASNSNIADDTLYLLAPGQIVSWLATYDTHFERIRGEFTLIPNQNLVVTPGAEPSAPGISPAVLASIGVQRIRMCYVLHCPNAFGITVDVDGEHRITYSGDTIPCDDLIYIGRDSTLLIHEATMEDDLADEARFKMHSTTSQAIDMGQRMKAKFTVLTHFSQRYARLPRLNSHILIDNTSVGIAFDNMQITMSDLDLLPHMYAPLQLMFAEHCVDMEMRADKRALKKARETTVPDSKHKDAPSCQVIHCAHAPVVNMPMYRESNASRLRSEIKRIPPEKRSARSKSCSSTKSTNNSSAKCYITENTAPETPIDDTTPRTVSDTSNFQKGTRERTHIVDGHVIDKDQLPTARSKTLNTASAAPSTDKLNDNKTRITKNEVTNVAPKDPISGYGKPLVTPLNKKLLIRREQNSGHPPFNFNSGNESGAVNRCRSPAKSWKADSKSSSSSVASYKRDTSRTRIPAKENVSGNSGYKSRLSTVGPHSPDTIARPKNNSMSKPVSSIPRRPNPHSRTGSADRKSDDAKNPMCKMPVWNTDPKLAPNNSPRYQTNGMRHPFSTKDTKPLNRSSDKQNTMAKNVNKPSTNNSGSKPKAINHTNKSFKPQLEDIKSSYLLLNKNDIDRNIDSPVEDNDRKTHTSTTYINESIRRVQLIEIKQKYRSREYWNDAKYEKIEGLNWITWK